MFYYFNYILYTELLSIYVVRNTLMFKFIMSRACWKTMQLAFYNFFRNQKKKVFFLFRKDRMIIFRLMYEYGQHMTAQHSFLIYLTYNSIAFQIVNI